MSVTPKSNKRKLPKKTEKASVLPNIKNHAFLNPDSIIQTKYRVKNIEDLKQYGVKFLHAMVEFSSKFLLIKNVATFNLSCKAEGCNTKLSISTNEIVTPHIQQIMRIFTKISKIMCGFSKI